MQNYIVALNIVTSSSVTESELADLLGVSAQSDLDCRPGREEGTVLWRFQPAYSDKTMTLAAHVLIIASEIQPGRPIRLSERIKDIYLDIGVLYNINELMICKVDLSMLCLASLVKKIPEFDIEITCHPCIGEQECGEEAEEESEQWQVTGVLTNNREVQEMYESWKKLGKPRADRKGKSGGRSGSQKGKNPAGRRKV